MNGISTTATVQAADSHQTTANAIKNPSKEDLEVREKFQDFVAGTFYKEMMKSMQKMHDKPAYFHGGQAEKMFQSQMDQQIAEDMARTHGGSLSDSLYKAYLARKNSQKISDLAPRAAAPKISVPAAQVNAAYAASSSHSAGKGK